MSTTVTETGPELADPVDAEAILANTRAVLPFVEKEADEVERLGRLTEPLKDVLARAGCFRFAFPRRLGGPELTLRDQTRVVELLCSADGSVGWNVKILSDSGFYASRLDAEAVDALYPSIDYATAGSFNPPGKARKVDGGYSVTGRWSYGSGVHSADQVLGGVHVFDGDTQVFGPGGAPLVLGAYLPREDVTIEDDWHVTGMRGSGSNSYSVVQAFVPDGHFFVRSAAPDVAADPLNRHVELPFYNAVGITLGIAGHALAVVRDRITSGPHPLADREGIKRLYGEAASLLDVARSHAYAVADEFDEVLFGRGGLLDDRQFARMLAMGPVTGQLARRVLELAVEMTGSASIYAANPMERIVRDMQTNLVHLQNQPRRWVDSAGRELKQVP
ncbi:acyl-CoA dehydrogenase family protein [Amycolatopsis jejuensis]|uniref:acyl-CoA dehydrogenase family protein n=1 Tax=Amycolatopsis jejuensis TaxID=330084 RepID=UPI00069119EC|nr:acyl-CoA dehydrogenase family protein [Amycolatopsis jejuensis]